MLGDWAATRAWSRSHVPDHHTSSPSHGQLVRHPRGQQPARLQQQTHSRVACLCSRTQFSPPTPQFLSMTSIQAVQQPRTLVVPPGLEGGALDTYDSMKGKCLSLMKEVPDKTSLTESSQWARVMLAQSPCDWGWVAQMCSCNHMWGGTQSSHILRSGDCPSHSTWRSAPGTRWWEELRSVLPRSFLLREDS